VCSFFIETCARQHSHGWALLRTTAITIQKVFRGRQVRTLKKRHHGEGQQQLPAQPDARNRGKPVQLTPISLQEYQCPLLHTEKKQRDRRPKVGDTFRDDMEIDHSRLTLWDIRTPCFGYGKHIAAGGNGVVFRHKNVSPLIEVNGKLYETVAIKVPKKEGVVALKSEVESLYHLSHDNVVQILGMIEGPAPGETRAWQMLLEYVPVNATSHGKSTSLLLLSRS
jgi:hypothetical protein